MLFCDFTTIVRYTAQTSSMFSTVYFSFITAVEFRVEVQLNLYN